MKENIVIIGEGNVGIHLFNALKEKSNVSIISSRNLDNISLKDCLCLICVKDDLISEIAKKLNTENCIIAHTSGSVPLSVLKPYSERTGVFYPLQTFSKNIEMSYSDIPFFIEASDRETLNRLEKTARLISNNIYCADSIQRKNLHLSSVFACNFTNALLTVAEDILKENNIPLNVLIPLLRQTIKKIEQVSPYDAQTGPAKRNDWGTMNLHLQLLENKPEYKEIYTVISNLIMKQHNNECN